MPLQSIRFISEEVEVYYKNPPQIKKLPHCPDGFTWEDSYYEVDEVLSEWFDFHRRGRSARNMIPSHRSTAERRASWGVGQYYFRIRTTRGRIFDLYYDRAPKSAGDRTGSWFLFRELAEVNPNLH